MKLGRCRRCGQSFRAHEAWRSHNLIGPFCGQACAEAQEHDHMMALAAESPMYATCGHCLKRFYDCAGDESTERSAEVFCSERCRSHVAMVRAYAEVAAQQARCTHCLKSFPTIEAIGSTKRAGVFCSPDCLDGKGNTGWTLSASAKGNYSEMVFGVDPTPNCTAVAMALYQMFEESTVTPRGLWSTAYRFWRTDPDVIASVEEVADHIANGRVSHGRLGRAYVLAWRNDYLGLRSRWVARVYRAESGA